MKSLPTPVRVRLASIVAAIAVVIAVGAFTLAVSPTNDSSGTVTSSTPATSNTTSTLSATTPTSTRSSAMSNSSTTTSKTVVMATTETANTSASVVTSITGEKRVVEIVLPMDVGDNESLNFQPARIRVVIGVNNTIVWSDFDAIQHTVKSTSIPRGAAPFNSGILNQGQTFSVTLTVPGIYRYDCSIHPDWMIGLIQVVA